MMTASVDRPLTPLRQRMLGDMALRGLRSDILRNPGRSPCWWSIPKAAARSRRVRGQNWWEAAWPL